MPLIVLEGIDGCGKTSVALKLIEKLSSVGFPAVYTREPFNRNLVEELLARFSGSIRDLAEVATMLIDRVLHVENVLKNLVQHYVVICDRYHYSTIAYQGALGYDIDLLLRLVDLFPKPDLAIYLRIDVDTAMKRIASREGKISIFEERWRLERAIEIFDELANRGYLVTVDATQPLPTVVSECAKLVLRKLRAAMLTQHGSER